MHGAGVGDEHEATARVDVERRTPYPARSGGEAQFGRPSAQLLVERAECEHRHVVVAGGGQHLALQDDAAEVMGLGGLGRHGQTDVVNEVEEILHLTRSEYAEAAATAGGNQKEGAPQHRPVLGDEADDVGEVVQVVAGDRGVDLYLDAEGASGVPGVEGPAEHAGDPAKGVVDGGGGAVQAQ